FVFFPSRRRHTRLVSDWSSDVCSSDLYEITQRLRRADGAYRWIQNSGFPLRDTKGQVARWCVLLTDIDDRKRAEEALLKREREQIGRASCREREEGGGGGESRERWGRW